MGLGQSERTSTLLGKSIWIGFHNKSFVSWRTIPHSKVAHLSRLYSFCRNSKCREPPVRTHYFESTFRFISFNWTVALNEITIKLDYFGKRKRKLHIWRQKRLGITNFEAQVGLEENLRRPRLLHRRAGLRHHESHVSKPRGTLLR